ncbi:hypothetical protein OIU93_04150 [Paeniglutamicibacter sp. ZC-3]|uniref:hypothetical protein n=1 Tax=Paeniglutamicibacter sp. ZC-3 TaxID=2986919 RepID=UPI0021F7A959|nr:hypothetical protein [Paeniglutamicibacter sp. ZC-3]MCV9993489.1 hypothetical protein [Paeniglutamicibacter sp. ZC-3]
MSHDRENPSSGHTVPPNTSKETIDALGKLSEALEVVEDARGSLYRFHRLTGRADLALGEAVDMFKDAGYEDIARKLQDTMVGRNVLEGRWTFQIMEEYDDGYYKDFKTLEEEIRQQLVEGRRHLFEAQMKEDRRTHGQRHHEASPPEEPL